MNKWISVKERLPDNGVLVHAILGTDRVVEKLKRQNDFWFTGDGKMYVYFTPTHWMPIETLKI